jgi:hypothetical protein
MVALTGGTNVDDIKIAMRSLGIISGHAFDETGAPLVGARVEALLLPLNVPYQRYTPVASVQTDDRGVFRLPALEPEQYYVRVLPAFDRSVADSFPTTYYPGALDPADAEKLTLTGGSELSGIDLRLVSHGVKIRGHIVRPKDSTDSTVLALLPRSPSVLVTPPGGLNIADETTDDFELRGAAPGSYYIYAWTRPAERIEPWWTRTPIEVGDKDIENLSIPIMPVGKIKGRIIVAADAIGADKLDLSKFQIDAATTELIPLPGWRSASRPDKDGNFEFPRVSEMKLFITGQTINDTWFISSVRFNGSDAITNGFVVAPGTEGILEVTISNASGTLVGVVKDGSDKPIPAGRIALLPETSRRANPFLIRIGVAIERGEFTIEVIPPGEYIAIALPDEDQFTPAFLREPRSIEKYERYGQHVHIGAGETTRMDLIAAPAEPK